jgi:hypothetical protein
MRRNVLSVTLIVASLLIASVSAFAHHSVSAEFDAAKPLEFANGVVKAVEWTNPHIYVQVEVKDTAGKVTVYRVEGGAPNALFRNGWRKDSLKPGQMVSFKGTRAKNPASTNVNGRLTLADGKVAWQGEAPSY